MQLIRTIFLATLMCVTTLGARALAEWPPRDEGSRDAPKMANEEPVPVTARGQAERLERALERYRDIEQRGGWKKVPTDLAMGPAFSYECSRIAAVEKRLVAEGYLRRVSTPPPPPPVPVDPSRRRPQPPPQPAPQMCEYGAALTEAVRAFQADRKILGYGQVGKQTMAEMNRPVSEIVDILERDVGRWRDLSLESSGNYIVVVIPFYELTLYENDELAMRFPVIVGQPTWQTPQFSAEVSHLILNPDWGIPEKIARQEYLPQLRHDPKALSRQGITGEGVSLRQKPGPSNPLGRVKFVMPNPYDVYLHDTPYKGAFNAAVKALSHGCIRLSRPLDLATYLLRDDPHWDRHRLEKEIATGKTEHVDLPHRIPVHILYATSRVNDEGRVELRADVYGMNSRRAREQTEREPSDESRDAWP